MLSLKAKIGLGVLLSYTSFEVYMQIRTHYVIKQRREQFKKFDFESDEAIDFSKFASTTVAGMFVNPFEEYRNQTAFEFVFVRVLEAVESIYGNVFEKHSKLPTGMGDGDIEDVLKLHKPDLELLRKNSQILQKCLLLTDEKLVLKEISPIRNEMIFTWLGQSCSIVQISGLNFITDPILSNHLISPGIGPKRLIPAPLDLDQIKYATNDLIDFVLVSHDHPDHLELDLAKKIGNSTTWIAPLGMKLKLARKGVYNVIEMDWWDRLPLNKFIRRTGAVDLLPDDYEIVCVPAMHWSGRYIIDSNKSLWCSFIIRRNDQSLVYHAGDTGYLNELFKTIGKAYGPLKLALLPIGQYCPSWHQKPRHISPEESILIAEETSLENVMGIHWGTFKISSEPILEPKFLMEKIARNKGKQDEFVVPDLGLSYVYDLSKPGHATKREVK